jgi:hypothetical protein
LTEFAQQQARQRQRRRLTGDRLPKSWSIPKVRISVA